MSPLIVKFQKRNDLLIFNRRQLLFSWNVIYVLPMTN